MIIRSGTFFCFEPVILNLVIRGPPASLNPWLMSVNTRHPCSIAAMKQDRVPPTSRIWTEIIIPPILVAFSASEFFSWELVFLLQLLTHGCCFLPGWSAWIPSCSALTCGTSQILCFRRIVVLPCWLAWLLSFGMTVRILFFKDILFFFFLNQS